MMLCLLFLSALLASWLCTGLLRRYALARSLIDIPNKRSSHKNPTPRGGGVSIVLVFLFVLPFLNLLVELPDNSLWALLGSGAWVALVGFFDDHGHVPARWRLLVHFCASAWALIWLGGLPPVSLFGEVLDFGWLGDILAVVYLVWLLNLYNFMDGIDGLAGIEAVTVCIGGALLYLFYIDDIEGWALPLLLMATAIGFLIWNFPPARIFMGDAGSGFVGLVLGVLSIQAGWVSADLLWAWVILMGVFVVDATVTLLHRVLRGEKFYEAHCSHAYQHAARRYHSHISVTLVVAGINLFWLVPMAALVVNGTLDGLVALSLAYIPLLFLAFHFKAGSCETRK